MAPPYGSGPYGGPPPPALRPGVIPLRPLRVGDILDGTIKLIRSNPKACLGLSAIVAAVASLPLAVTQALALGQVSAALSDPDAVATNSDSALGLLSTGGSLLSLIVSFFAVTVLSGVITRILGRAVFGERISIGEAWRLTRSRVPTLFGVALLTTLLMVAPGFVLLFLFWAFISTQDTLAPVVLLGLLGLFVYLPFLFFFATRFALAAPAVVLEGHGVTDALRRSWRLVTGDSWRVLGILLLTYLIAGFISSVLSFPLSIASAVIGFAGGGSTVSVAAVALLYAVGTTVGSMITYPFQAGVNGLLYADRRMRAEAFDLVLQTAAGGGRPASADDLWHPSNAAGAAPVPPQRPW